MDSSAEARLYDLATATLGRFVRASGQFHSIADPNPRSFEGKSVAEWLFLKTRSRLPAYPYVVVLPDELVMLEFRHSSTIKLKRVVGRWPLSRVEVTLG